MWLTVDGYEKLAGGTRNQKRASVLNYLLDSLHLVAKVKVFIFLIFLRNKAGDRVKGLFHTP